MKNAKEILLWSIALPGFGQLLNGKYVKGITLILLEFLINVCGLVNEVIMYSFLGEIGKAIETANYQWIMFYPCLYFFAMWDAYKDAGGGKKLFASLPFVFAAYTMTIGVIFSSKFTIFGVILGPIWLPLLSIIPGVLIGYLLQMVLRNSQVKSQT
ncbi:hypothetical protein ACIQ34_00915 [Ureibacillus sp. NPDC094379]